VLRVGLTGSLGSGKSTVGGFLKELGAEVCAADELGRTLMEPGQRVYEEIVRTFGPAVVINPSGRLDRGKLAELAFQGGRLQELNAIVHPAVIAAQQQWMEDIFSRSPQAVAVIESALIFEVERDARARGESEGVLADWRRRIDCVIVVTAPDELKIERSILRLRDANGGVLHDPGAAEADARNRLSHQIPDSEKTARADFVLDNSADILSLRRAVKALWQELSNSFQSRVSLQ
jgi:dephospho-CoA kinase